MITLSWLFIITVLAAALALVDGIARLSGRRSNSILAIAELLFAVLMLLSLFIPFPAPLGTFLFAVLLEIALIVLLFVRGVGRRGIAALTVVALILNTAVLLISAGWLTIPGLS